MTSIPASKLVRALLRPGLAALCALGANTALACATCGCTLSTDAITGAGNSAGWQLSLQYDFINQDQLRSGRSPITASQVAAINNAAGDQEVEHGTLNRYLTAGLSYSPDAVWTYKLLLPYVDRSHSTYGAASNPLSSDEISSGRVSSIGDAKLLITYQGLLSTQALSLQIGLKLPTGHYGGPSADGKGIVGRSPVPFTRGPNAQQPWPGNLMDTSLQAGTGSTDLIAGASFTHEVGANLNAFYSGQVQLAVRHLLTQPGADFRPGNSETLSAGIRYVLDPVITPQLQLNVFHKSADQGALADTANTAGTVAYLSPGISMAAGEQTHLYGFIQLPLYSRLSGYQLFPRWTVTLGVTHAF